MKIRRALAAAAATAVIAPAALLAAPAAYATDDPTTEPSVTATETPSDNPSDPTEEPSDPESTPPTEEPPDSESTPPTEEPSDPESAPPTEEPASSPSPTTSTEPSPEPSTTEPPCEDEGKPKLDIAIGGLPGKIVAGSGWHKFSLTVTNSSTSTVSVDYFAAASADRNGENIFRNKQVVLQAYNPQDGVWENVTDGEGNAVGYVGYTDELKPNYEVTIPLRINVKASAPIGAGFTLGAGVYLDEKECSGVAETAYKFQIVAPGTHTGGTKPQAGGKLPVPTEKPDHSEMGKVSGSLAETGSSSALPAIATIGGVAMVVGAGAIFVVRRRKAAGSQAAA